MKIGLVVEGGGMRGMYASGVIDVLLENKIEADGVIGVSAGAGHGANFVSKQIGRSIRYYKNYVNDPHFMSLRSWITTGDYVNSKYCYHDIPEKLDPYDYKTAEASHTKFYATVTNVETAKAEYIEITDWHKQIDYLRASASLPFVARIVHVNGKKYMDGGIADSIPVEAMLDMKYDKIIVILTRHRGYHKEPEYDKIPNLFYHKYPKFWKLVQTRYIHYNETLALLDQLENEGKVIVIRPSKPLTCPRLTKDINEIQKVYDIGYQDGLNKLEEIKAYIKSSDN